MCMNLFIGVIDRVFGVNVYVMFYGICIVFDGFIWVIDIAFY